MSQTSYLNMLRRQRPSTTAEAVAQSPIGRPKLVVKSALLQYLASFFDERGINRPLLDSVCPAVSMYDAGTTPDEESGLKRHLQLARLFDNLTAKLPAILITDGGMTAGTVGLGSYDTIHRDPVHGVLARVTNKVTMSLTITIGSMDETTTDDIAATVAMALGPLRRIGGGDEIKVQHYDKNNYPVGGVIHLPMRGVTVSPASGQAVGDDPREQMYLSSIDLGDITFEASVWTKYENRIPNGSFTAVFAGTPNEAALKADVGVPNLRKAYPAIVDPGGPVLLGQRVTIQVRYRPPGSKLYSDNPNVAVMQGDLLIPKAMGTTKVRLVMPGAVRDQNRVLAEQDVTINWR